MAEEYVTGTVHLWHEKWTHRQNNGQLGPARIGGSQKGTHQWKSTLGKYNRDKIHFGMQPTGLHDDITKAQATVNNETDRSILPNYLQYKRQHTAVSNMTHLANRHKEQTTG